MTKLPFYKRISRVTVKGKELTTDQTNPYIDPNWFQANQESEKKMPTGVPNVQVSNAAVARRRKQIVEMTRQRPMKGSEIERALGYSRGGAWVMLHTLKDEGKLTRVNGYWMPPDKASDQGPSYYRPVPQGRVAIPQTPISIPERTVQPEFKPVQPSMTQVQPPVQPEPEAQPIEKPKNERIMIDEIEKLAKDFVWETDGPHTLRGFVAWMRQR